MDDSSGSAIAHFYARRCILVTGVTGFVGKILVEKLLRSCPDIDNIYLLIRDKSGTDVNLRVRELIESPVFANLRNSREHALQKLIAVSGDVTLPGLGLTPEALQLLRSRVSVVFHAAARVRFDCDLKSAVEINVKGTQRIIDLCATLGRLEAFVHVSTTYIHLDKGEINEIIYPAPVDPRKLMACVDSADPAGIRQLIQSILRVYPNVYGCTKAVSEQLLSEQCSKMPLAIVRPSIVTPAAAEPIPGWTDSINGPTGYIAGAGKGFLRALRFDPNVVGDIIPVDMVVNMMIAAAWNRGIASSKGIKVFNCCSGSHNPLTWIQLSSLAKTYVMQNPPKDMIWYPSFSSKSNLHLHRLDIWLYHTLPAHFLDFVARLCGRNGQLGLLYRKADRAMTSLHFYTIRQWHFSADHLVALIQSMSPADRRLFDFDVRRIHWPTYMKTYVLGIRQFIHKDDPASIPQARCNLKKFYLLRLLVRIVLLIVVLTILSFLFLLSQKGFTVLFDAMATNSTWPTRPSDPQLHVHRQS